MTKKRFIWKIDAAGHGYIYDRVTRKTVSQHKKILLTLNQLWEQVMRFEKYNQELIEENIRLQENKDYANNLEKSYKDYYGKSITQAEWYGYIKRCYE